MLTLLPDNKLIDSSGLPKLGHFDTPVTELGLADFAYRTVMDKPTSALARYFHYKQFQFISICHSDWQIGIAIADIRYAANAFCYFHDRNQQQLDQISLLRPLSVGVQMSHSPTAGTASIKGKQQICITPAGYDWQLKLKGERLNGELTLQAGPAPQPLALCTATGYNGWTYTQKHNALKVTGSLQYRGKPLDLSRALAGYDFSAGYMRRETTWRWGSISALLPEGAFGLNLACGVNETGTTENCLWLNGEKQLLGSVNIALNRQHGTQPWQFGSADNRINLQFFPQQCRQERLNLGLLASNFRQYCGEFSGEILLNSGKKLKLDQIPGLAEDHFARW
ncbi:DUF2804 domain-containing protein [Rheinheimera aquimaris]|uniref:DUF2804 domain-containing protein n=1 Tax=Rheinheimera aquimaris TaxID=412437 RepID=A0ABN1DUB2_9GAMM|nr:DUF2804 domain-containing protein [Rheinheimera aquimaris]MCB5214076.1 DUF2804 domain-containing protein [Rheinheimera aquimaris]